MMFFCAACHRVYLVAGQADELRSLIGEADTFPCITPQCGGMLRKVGAEFGRRTQKAGLKSETVPAVAFFRAINGFGLSTGDPASVEEVRKLLLNHRVARVLLEEVGQPERTIVNKLWLDNGVCLHFGSSAKGACVYYIERPGPSCVEVFDERAHDAGTGAGERTSPDGEEDGRAPAAEDGAGGATGAESAASEPALVGPGVPAVPEGRDV